jgi:mycothione reductase
MADFDLAIIGSGSGNALVTEYFDDKQVAIIEHGVFGGTCLNVGCIPTKMYVYAADVAMTIRDSARYGIDATVDSVRWRDIRDRIFDRIDPISASGEEYRANGANTTLFHAHARFTGPHSLRLSSGDEISAENIVIAAGGRPTIPDLVTDAGVPFHTSDTIMRIDDLPESLVILGSGYVAAEFAHIFSALGTKVTLVARNTKLLRHFDAEISDGFTQLAAQQWDVRLGAQVAKVSGDADDVRLDFGDGTSASGDLLLIATGRISNSDGLDLDSAGITALPGGRILVDRFGRTNVAGVWALGDVSSPYQLKHVSNHEARIIAHNLASPEDLLEIDHRYVPAAVFSRPQIATVGLTEEEVRGRGRPYVAATQDYGGTAYGWAMEDTTGICKLIADPETGLLLGAHLMGDQASSLIQPLIQAMSFGQPVAEVARGQYWIHPALAEVVENALLMLGLS